MIDRLQPLLIIVGTAIWFDGSDQGRRHLMVLCSGTQRNVTDEAINDPRQIGTFRIEEHSDYGLKRGGAAN